MKKYKYIHAPIGLLEIEESDGYLTALNFVKYQKHPDSSTLVLQEAKWQLQDYFDGKRKSFNLPLLFDRSEFYKEVYAAVLNIPYSTTITYKELADILGKPKASRAIGSALKNNPIPVIVPCHRIIKSDGSLGEYKGEKESKVKKWLLDHEKGIIS